MRTARQALAAAKKESRDPSRSWLGWCLAFTRTCWGIKPTGIPDANAAWELAKKKHADGTPPAGAPVYWKVGRFGHIAPSAGSGKVYSNDIVRRGKINLVDMDEIARQWGATYRGWSEDYCGIDLPLDGSGPVPQPAGRTHTVKEGDTLTKLAARFDTTVDKLVRANGLDDADVILVGQVLRIPR